MVNPDRFHDYMARIIAAVLLFCVLAIVVALTLNFCAWVVA